MYNAIAYALAWHGRPWFTVPVTFRVPVSLLGFDVITSHAPFFSTHAPTPRRVVESTADPCVAS
jgi:hypothetical protein